MKLPLYKVQITDMATGMFTISLVDSPAVESDFLCFDEDRQPLQFKVENEEKRIITGVIMRCNHPIYRVGTSGYEYYIMFDEPTIEVMAEKWLAEGFQNSVNLQHNPEAYVDGVFLKEVYFKDVERGVNPKGFEDIEDKSLFGTYKVLNDDVWAKIKDGTFKGFSLEGTFDMVEVKPEQTEEEKLMDEVLDLLEKEMNKRKKK